MIPIADKLRTELDEREFYELMQAYRNAPRSSQVEVSRCFRAVTSYLVRLVAHHESPDPVVAEKEGDGMTPEEKNIWDAAYASACVVHPPGDASAGCRAVNMADAAVQRLRYWRQSCPTAGFHGPRR